MSDLPFLINITECEQEQGTTIEGKLAFSRVLLEYTEYSLQESIASKDTIIKNIHVHNYEKELRVLHRLYIWCSGERVTIQAYKPMITLSYMATHLLLLKEQSYARMFAAD